MNSQSRTTIQKMHEVTGFEDVSKCPYHKAMNYVNSWNPFTNKAIKQIPQQETNNAQQETKEKNILTKETEQKTEQKSYCSIM